MWNLFVSQSVVHEKYGTWEQQKNCRRDNGIVPFFGGGCEGGGGEGVKRIIWNNDFIARILSRVYPMQ